MLNWKFLITCLHRTNRYKILTGQLMEKRSIKYMLCSRKSHCMYTQKKAFVDEGYKKLFKCHTKFRFLFTSCLWDKVPCCPRLTSWRPVSLLSKPGKLGLKPEPSFQVLSPQIKLSGHRANTKIDLNAT